MEIKEILNSIKPVDNEAGKRCIEHFDQVAKPLGSLGKFEELLAKIASITGSEDINIDKKAVLVFCADNGVVKQGVAQGDHVVTTAIGGMLGIEKASVSIMAKTCNADVFSIDIGMVDEVHGLRDCKLMNGTNDFTEGAAMSREIAEKAIHIGIEMVKELKDKGYKLIATGEAGIGNTTTSSAICSVLLNCSVHEVTGRGAGLDDEGLNQKISAIEKGIKVNNPNKSDPIDVLHKLGGLDIAAMTGVFIGGALYNLPVVMDGFISGVAALVAVRLCNLIKNYIIPSHESEEPGAKFLINELGFSPVLQAKMRLGEGTGAVALFPLLDMTLSVYKSAATYNDINIEQYKKLT